MRLRLALLAAVVITAVGLALGLGLSRGPRPASDTRPPNPLTPKIVACERSGKLICDRAAYVRDRFPLRR